MDPEYEKSCIMNMIIIINVYFRLPAVPRHEAVITTVMCKWQSDMDMIIIINVYFRLPAVPRHAAVILTGMC